MTGSISDREIDVARTKYKDDENLAKILNDMKANDSSRGLIHDLKKVGGNVISKLLVILIDKKFAELK